MAGIYSYEDIRAEREHVYILALLDSDVRSVSMAHVVMEMLVEAHGDNVDLTVVDVTKRPQVMEIEELLAIPALIKVRPGPRAVVVGDLDSTDRWRDRLGLSKSGGSEKSA